MIYFGVLDECNSDSFNSEIVMECMKRTNDLHTTQQCLMLLSKGAQLFPVRFLIIKQINVLRLESIGSILDSTSVCGKSSQVKHVRNPVSGSIDLG